MGFAIDNLYIPPEISKPYYATLRDIEKGKAKLITSHGVGRPIMGNGPSAVQMLAKNELLGPDILISNANFPHESDAELFAKSGAHLSCTPNMELQMGWPPVALQEEHHDHASVGVDCHSRGSASIPRQMNLLLQYSRCRWQEKLAEEGMWSRHTVLSVEQVFNLETVGGAKVIGMEDEIGRLKVGMKADLVVFDAMSPGMLAAAEEDPIAAVVLHSSPMDVEMVIVDGIVRKEEEKLVDVFVEEGPVAGKEAVEVGQRLRWRDVTEKVLESRKGWNEKMEGVDMKAGEEFVMDWLYANRKGLLEEQKS